MFGVTALESVDCLRKRARSLLRRENLIQTDSKLKSDLLFCWSWNSAATSLAQRSQAVLVAKAGQTRRIVGWVWQYDPLFTLRYRY